MTADLCGCCCLEIDCRILRELEAHACCWACEHALPPDIRPQAHVGQVKA